MKTYENHVESFRRQEMHHGSHQVYRWNITASKIAEFSAKKGLDLPEDPYVVKKNSLSRWTFLVARLSTKQKIS